MSWQLSAVGETSGEGHLFCADLAAAITERSAHTLNGSAVEVSLSLSCQSNNYLTQGPQASCKTHSKDCTRDVSVLQSCEAPMTLL